MQLQPLYRAMGKRILVFSCLFFSTLMTSQNIAIHSTHLNEDREINVKLPDGYEDSKATYPIILLTDGQALFDFVNGLFTYNWDIYSQAIVVGIDQKERHQELVPAKGNKEVHSNFFKFVHDKLLPKLKLDYRTNGIVMVIGHSFGGYFSLKSLLKSDKVQYAISISPTLWGSYLKTINQEIDQIKFTNQKSLYLGVADGDHELIRKNTRELNTKFSAENFSVIQSSFSLYVDEDHNSSILIGIRKGLKTLFESWPTKFSEEQWKELKDQSDPTLFYNYFDKLSKKFGQLVIPGEEDLNTLGYFHLNQNQIEQAIKVFERNNNTYPTSSNTYDSLADAYEKKNDFVTALKMVRKALKIEKEGSNDAYLVEQYNDRIGELSEKVDN